MNLVDQFWYGWPWMGLGMGVVILVLLFGTNLLRSDSGSRWLDPVWLAWAAMPAYLLHQFEEYCLNLTVKGTYIIIDQVFVNASSIMDLSSLPLAYFPLVNIGLVWVGVPICALLARKNPVIGLAPYGFILANGLMHCLGTLSGMMPVELNPGFWTGTVIFLPLVVIVVYATVRKKFMSGSALAVAIVAGVLAHVMLGAGYAACAAAGPATCLVLGCVAGVSPAVFAWIGCLIFRVRYNVPGVFSGADNPTENPAHG